jgi:hypothetical protein
MRLAGLTLFLSAGTWAFCQSPAPAPANPEQNWLTLPELAKPGLAQPGRDFTRLPPQLHFDFTAPMKAMTVPAPDPLRRWNDAQIDPKIVVHPPQSSLGKQAPGALVAQNLYPGLNLLPIQESEAKGEPIPTAWPNLKVKNIPIVWPKLEIKPVDSRAPGPAAGK